MTTEHVYLDHVFDYLGHRYRYEQQIAMPACIQQKFMYIRNCPFINHHKYVPVTVTVSAHSILLNWTNLHASY